MHEGGTTIYRSRNKEGAKLVNSERGKKRVRVRVREREQEGGGRE